MPEPAAPENPSVPALTEISGSQKFVDNMMVNADRFGDWVEQTMGKAIKGDQFTEGFESLGNVKKSRSYLKKNLAIVGLYDIGMTIAGFKLGLPKEAIFLLWESTFLAPFLEELGFRTGFASSLSKEAAKLLGINLTDQQGRIASSAIFSALHLGQFPDLLLKSAHGVKDFLGGEFFTKVAQEKGIWASVYHHSLINAAILGIAYTAEMAKTMPKDQAAMVNVACWSTLLGGVTGISLIGLKELIEDRKIQKDLGRLLQADRLDKSLGIPQMADFAKQLLNHVNSKGYKFRAGVETAYFLGLLEANEYTDQPGFKDHQARKFVSKLIESTGEDTENKIKLAMSYIDQRLLSPSRAARPRSGRAERDSFL